MQPLHSEGHEFLATAAIFNKKIHSVVMATVLSKNRSAIYSTAQSTAELTEAALTAHWEMQADFCSLGELVSSISCERTQPFAN